MKKPFIYIHCLTSLDGKLMGNYMKLPEESAAAPFFKEIGFGGGVYPMRAMLNGTNTCASDYTYGKAPELDENAAPVPEGDYIAEKNAERYLIALDRNGRLGWDKSYVEYAGAKQHVVSVITEHVSNSYKAFLRKKGVSYIICGKDAIDFDILFDKLVTLLDIECLKIGGGGTINWTLIRGGYVDEVSIVIAPAADGSTKSPQLFMATDGNNEDIPAAFEFKECKVDEASGGIWLRYKVKKVWEKEEYKKTFGEGPKDFIAVDNSGK